MAEKNSHGTTDTSPPEFFTSRWGMLMTAIGIAIGTGNIWRFPRVAAANGGGVFILLWTVFLFLWSIPLLTAESAIGRTTRRGTLGAFTALVGPRGAWLGGFVALTTTGIMCYYSVVTGWCFKYLISSLTGSVNETTGIEYWHGFAGSPEAVGYHLFAALVTGVIVLAGVRHGIEGSAKVCIPVLAAILVYSAVRALFLPGALRGVSYLFQFDPADFLKPKVYLEALSQSAWSTGAGWGLLLTYSVYARPRERVVENSIIMGLADNTASIIAALAVIPTVFALLPFDQAMAVARTPGENSTGLTFIWIPRLLGGSAGGRFTLALFFLALVLAALTSLISMVEMLVRNLIDLGIGRKAANPGGNRADRSLRGAERPVRRLLRQPGLGLGPGTAGQRPAVLPGGDDFRSEKFPRKDVGKRRRLFRPRPPSAGSVILAADRTDTPAVRRPAGLVVLPVGGLGPAELVEPPVHIQYRQRSVSVAFGWSADVVAGAAAGEKTRRPGVNRGRERGRLQCSNQVWILVRASSMGRNKLVFSHSSRKLSLILSIGALTVSLPRGEKFKEIHFHMLTYPKL